MWAPCYVQLFRALGQLAEELQAHSKLKKKKEKEKKRLERRKLVNYFIHLNEVALGKNAQYQFVQTACVLVLPERQAGARLWERKKRQCFCNPSPAHQRCYKELPAEDLSELVIGLKHLSFPGSVQFVRSSVFHFSSFQDYSASCSCHKRAT